MQPGDVFVLSQAFRIDPAIAACRAGARGTVDLEYADDLGAARAAVERLDRHTDRPFGVKVAAHDLGVLDDLLAWRPRHFGWIVLAGGDGPALAATIDRLHAAGLEVYFEAINASEMQRGAASGADGLILKGHEAAGRVGEETSFILIQRWFRQVAPTLVEPPPVWIQGGIGLNTAAACVAAGARGVVLDSQILLSREATCSEATHTWLRNFDGSQTTVLGDALGERLRVAHWPRSPLSEALAAEARRIADEHPDPDQQRAKWRQAVAGAIRQPATVELGTLSQDAACAAPLADRYRTVGGIVQAFVQHVRRHLESARRLRPLDEGSPLAASHGTRYPILQGPMTRVSDTAAFAEVVAREGGLPFLALALLRKAEVESLLRETRDRLGDLPWGAGILGFLPPEIRQEQTAAILETRPPFALIAGGRPDQARQFEEQGIPTYLHVPSPGLLRLFLKDGTRRFILEGRECGGHVGPRTSFVLWDAACEVILEHLGTHGSGEDLHIVFAGGIHDDLSGAMVAATAARLAERGVRIGVLMGTAYLFTSDAVSSGTIVDRFQQEAIRCQNTVLLETGPGHAIRCVPTPYCESFQTEKRRLQDDGRPTEEITRKLEWMNVGRLRVASKGIDHDHSPGKGESLVAPVADDEQYARGMYMIGQVSTLRDDLTTIADLHASVCQAATQRLDAQALAPRIDDAVEAPCDIAVIGMSCFYPGAGSLREFWSNILRRVYCVTEIPETHWDWSLYYNSDPLARDKIVSKWGGFLGDVAFDPFRYGITPAAMKVIEPLQFLMLEAVNHALHDAGYAERPFNRERTAAICGIGGGGSPMATLYGLRACMPLLDRVPGMPVPAEEILSACAPLLPEWTEDSFPGFLMNVAVGRVANRFDLGGPNYAVDAACASSLAAVQLAVRELQLGTSDVALAMGADTVQTPFAYMAFSKTFALSRQGRCRPFDADADGIVLSEGIGVVVLKRLADAERDGDRIMAVIRGVGSSSDGRDKGLTAPNASGQIRALERAYRQARISPSRVELVEAHGTGTVVGDRTEAGSLGGFLRRAGAEPASCAVGSVKSMIGHSKCAAGIAGLIKTTLSLHHKVLPPTLVEKPNPHAGFEGGPLYLNTQPRPWIHGAAEPRCAGVSAFGFGGTNFHVVLEEYTRGFLDETPPAQRDWDAELVVFRQPTRERLLQTLQQVQQGLARGGRPRLVDLAAAIWRSNSANPAHPVLTIVVGTLDELREKLPLAMQTLRGADAFHSDPRGVYFAEEPQGESHGLAFLFPGQGSQYPNMLADLAMAFPCVRGELDAAEGVLAGLLPRPLGRFIYPPHAFDEDGQRRQAEELARTDVAQPALAATSAALLALLRRMHVHPQFIAGHSSGEYAALFAAGCLSQADLIRIAHRRGELMSATTEHDAGAMAAVEGDAQRVMAAVEKIDGISLANLNSPRQTVISGSRDALETAIARLTSAGLRTQILPVSCAFHSPHVAGAGQLLAAELAKIDWSPPAVSVFSNLTAQPYPTQPAAITDLLARHVTSPVRFVDEIEAMYAAGAHVFLEVGPQGVLTGLVKQILGEQPHTAMATDLKGRSGIAQLAGVLAQLLIRGVPVDAGIWHAPRITVRFDLADLEKQTEHPPRAASTWIVNSVRARPLHAPEPLLLGQRFSEDRWRAVAPSSTAAVATSATNSQPPSVSPQLVNTSARTDSMLAATGQPPSGRPAMMPEIPAQQMPPPDAHADGRADSAREIATPDGVVDEAAIVMCRFQDVMARFLETQQSVLRDYFQAVSGGLPASLPEGVSEASPEMNRVLPAARSPSTVSGMPPAPAAIADVLPSVASNGEMVVVEQAIAAIAADEQIAPPTREELTWRLLELVCKRTGYPREMLDLDLDLEADLGVDSIKRVEILSTLAESLGGQESDLGGRLELEKLTVLRTLRGILDYLDQTVLTNGRAPAKLATAIERDTVKRAALPHYDAPSSNGQPTSASGSAELRVQRALVELVDAPMSTSSLPVVPHGTVLITDDGRGIAREVGQRLADFGQRVFYLRWAGSGVCRAADDSFECDLADPAQIEQLFEILRNEVGAIGGLVHLSTLSASLVDETPQERATRDVKSLYLLARALEEDLCRAAANGGALLLGAMSLGGQLGFDDGPLSDHFRAGHGGIAGFLKCVAQEWDDVLVRAVDLDLGAAPDELADLLLAELGDPNGPVEVGVTRGRRVTWQPVDAPLNGDTESLELDQGASVLITGGARGITARVAVALARRWQPHLVLVGRTPLPENDEPADVIGLSDQAEIKQALIRRCREAGKSATPSAVEAEYRRLMAQRDVRATLAEISRCGSTWEYHALDVRDATAFGELLDELNRRGGVQGVIHGAGVIEDRLLRDKTAESFDHVFQTKVDSAYVLSKRLDPAQLRFCILFASLASRYGNRGQSDYAAANEVLSKLAVELDRRWPGRVCSIAWGPWSQVGMVAELEPHLVRRGLKLISPEEGPRFVLDEIALGRKGDCEVIVAGGAERLVRPRTHQTAESR